MAKLSFAEPSVGIIAGSIPPCRAFVLQMLRKVRGQAAPNKNTTGASNSRSGHRYIFKRLSRITNALSWSRANPHAPGNLQGSRILQKNYVPTNPWDREGNRAASQDSGRELILPLYKVPDANLESGKIKTVDLTVRTGEYDSSFATNDVTQF